MVIKIIKSLLLLIVFISIIAGCKKSQPQEKLTTQPYEGNQLKTNGYYYQAMPDSSNGECYFFYRNGLILNVGFSLKHQLQSESLFVSNGWDKTIKNDMFYWGTFVVNGNNLTLKKRLRLPYTKTTPDEWIGNILDDTTFRFTTHYDGTTKLKPLNETYHFIKFTPKPDSTNKFIP